MDFLRLKIYFSRFVFLYSKNMLYLHNINKQGISFLKLIDSGIELETRALPQDERYNAVNDIQKEAENLGINR